MNAAERPSKIAADVLDRIAAIVGPRGHTRDPAEIEPLTKSWRDNWQGWVPMVVKPASTEEVAAVVKLCAETNTPIVPQGGNTGLTGASQPHADGSEIILSLSRMNRIREIDTLNDTMTVEAGVVLQTIQQAAAEADRLFPLSLGAQGSCQIGGNLSTNAGGTQVLRYGNTRNLALGLEVVLPDGRVWDGLRGLRKDNTGYDLKQLFIGAEGTLGIITAAVLRLFPKPRDVQTAVVAVPDPTAAVKLLSLARQVAGEQVTGFELMKRNCVEIAVKHIPNTVDPIRQAYPWYVLVELTGQGSPGTLREPMETLLGEGLEAGLVLDATIAASGAQSAQMWKLREAMAEAQNYEGASIKHDVSVPVSKMPDFIGRATTQLEAAYPGIRVVCFGHIGDGNVHFNPAQPVGADKATFAAETPAINRIVHDLIAEYAGSISAEHGLGRLRMAEAAHYKSAVELDLMRTVKAALDPRNIMNPGKVVPPA
jgi:FAD/FMN-containing dehydrogenase